MINEVVYPVDCELCETYHSVAFCFMKKTYFPILAGSAFYQIWLGWFIFAGFLQGL